MSINRDSENDHQSFGGMYDDSFSSGDNEEITYKPPTKSTEDNYEGCNSSDSKNSLLSWLKLSVAIILVVLIFIGIVLCVAVFGNNGILRGETGMVSMTDNEITSNFGVSTEYDCSGVCYCYSGEEEERRIAGATTRGVSYIAVALTTLMAIKTAKDYFEDECKSHFTTEECPYTMIESDVESCERHDDTDVGEGKFDPFQIDALGVIHTPYTKRKGMPISQTGAKGSGGWIEIFPEYASAIDDLDGFSHIYVTFVFHEVKKTMLKVNPIFDPKHERGILSSRAPMRPNRLGLSLVEIIKIEGNSIYIDGIDTVDGTPVVDIKPYLPGFDSHPEDKDVRTGWFEATDDQVKNKKFKSGLKVFDDSEK